MPRDMMNSIEDPYERLEALGVKLPPARPPVGLFVPVQIFNGMAFVSGQGPVAPGGQRHTGKVGSEVSVDDAYHHARLVGVNLLAVLHDQLGSLRRIERIVKVLGFVNGAPGFGDHPRVINGCSDLLLSVFGPDRGAHARSAIGAGSLPNGITVEIELIVGLSPAG
ncbi:MAG: RidA family protein [Mesorhizobium sp.]|nr:RidA family protein [Mesorhizobium sp.]MCO5161780.1 RidA family protein [Mesorhizobium sp.]